jgi:4-amino-4-deoxy-L-arabinose transferase-like glycosyltransferase
VIRLVQTLLYLSTIITTVLIARRIFGTNRVGLLAAVLMAMPTVNVTLYTTVSLGGYGEALLIGNLTLLVGLVLIERRAGSRTSQLRYVLAFCLGLLIGFGLWANGLTLVFAAPVGIAWLWSLWQGRKFEPLKVPGSLLLLAIFGFFVGSAPWLVHAIQVGWTALLAELFGSAVAVESSPWILRILAHLFNFMVLGLTALFGLRPPWDVRWLALPLMPFALAFWFATIAFFIRQAVRQNPYRSAYRILLGIVLAVTAGFVLTPFGVDPSGRYFLPLTVPLALAAAHMITTLIPKTRWQMASWLL